MVFQVLFLCCIVGFGGAAFAQSVTIDGSGTGAATGKLFEGVGAVSGGGATSVFLKDYPEPQRSQILDYLYKPKFGASMQTLFFEIGGDANSTQGSELSHMHTRTDLNYQRGYEWWLMKQAKMRDPTLTLDGVAWGCPNWVGNNNFYSADMQHYNIEYIKGLKSTYGINLDAIGCRNENGVNYTWAEQMKDSLVANGLTTKLHGFDNWTGSETGGHWGFVCDATGGNAALTAALDVCSAHTTCNDASDPMPSCGLNSNKSFWDTEEHAYLAGYACEQAIVNDCNQNYISNGRITKTVFWYLIEAYYSVENFTNQTMMRAIQPWSGHYEIDPGLWGYAHYNQFVDLGWQYINNACGNLSGGGTYVTLKSPGNTDFSVIIETKGASGNQTLNFTIAGGLPTNKPLCVWMSNSSNQFVQQANITPTNGSFSITVAANSIYSISTTTGQQKGTFSAPIPASAAFPPVYYENFDHYTGTDAKLWGYLPYYTCDICGAFEVRPSPTGTGKSLYQVLNTKADSWANEWAPYTLIGNVIGTNYEVSADVYFDSPSSGGWAGVMGRVNSAGDGYHAYPKGYYLRLSPTGAWGLYYANFTATDGTQLASGSVTLSGGTSAWHNLKLQMNGSTLTCFIDNTQVTNPAVTNSSSGNGVAGLCTGSTNNTRNTAYFDNLLINTVNGTVPAPTVFAQDANPPYAFNTVDVGKIVQPISARMTSTLGSYKVVGGEFIVPKEFEGKTLSANVYNVEGRLMQKTVTKNAVIKLGNNFGRTDEVFIVKLKAID
jgi:galactosylceramidase